MTMPDAGTAPNGTAGRPVRTVLLTGAAGRVATAVRPHLRARFALRLHDRVPPQGPGPTESVVLGDLADPAHARDAVRGVDAVVHLACVHGVDLTFEAGLDANYRAVVHLLEAARAEGVERFVYASSHHVHGAHRRAGFAGDGAAYAPDAYYGLGKAFGELACAVHAERFGLRVLVVRIGNADPTVADDRSLRMWTSGGDLAELFAIGLVHPDVRHDVVYGVSECPEPLYANARAHALGYRARDRALDHLGDGFAPYEAMAERAGRDFVGGAYAVAPLPTTAPPAEEAP